MANKKKAKSKTQVQDRHLRHPVLSLSHPPVDSAVASSGDCDRSSIRLLISPNSDTNALVLLPASVAASISVVNRMAVARSALHSRQPYILLWNMGIVSVIFGAVIGCFIAIPMLSIVSFREWVTIRPAAFSAWRNRVGIGALGTILSIWLFFVVLTVLRFINDSWIGFFTEKVNQAVVAGLLLVLLALMASFWLPVDWT
jgi:hypothetical protein